MFGSTGTSTNMLASAPLLGGDAQAVLAGVAAFGDLVCRLAGIIAHLPGFGQLAINLFKGGIGNRDFDRQPAPECSGFASCRDERQTPRGGIRRRSVPPRRR